MRGAVEMYEAGQESVHGCCKLLLWVVGRPTDPGIQMPCGGPGRRFTPPMPADREARERLAVRWLAEEIHASSGVIPESGAPSSG